MPFHASPERPGWRAALELAEAAAEIVEEGNALIVRLAGQEEAALLAAASAWTGWSPRPRPPRRKALHAAALIAVRRSVGIEPNVPDAAPAAVAAPLSVDRAFLIEARAALAEACRLGLALAPLALEERLFGLSVSSRADSLPRLGAMLRGIAGMIRARRARSFSFDPDACLGLIAAADALVRALIAAREPDRLTALAGTARQEYAPSDALQLHGAGAETWRAPTGARGVTGYFRESGSDRWLTLSIARGPGQDPLFDPLRAYTQEAIWGGHTLATLSKSHITVGSVGVSATGRMSSNAAGVALRGTSMIQDEPESAVDHWPPPARTAASALRRRFGESDRRAPAGAAKAEARGGAVVR